MPRGKPAKSAEQHRAEGTYRADRHAALEGPPPAPAVDLSAPPDVVNAGLAETWDNAVSDLCTIGTITKTDLEMLVVAFWHRANAQRIKSSFETLLDEDIPNPSNVSKLQSALASATGKYTESVYKVEAAVRLRPKPKAADYLARI